MIKIERDSNFLFILLILINAFFFFMVALANHFFRLQLLFIFIESALLTLAFSFFSFYFIKASVSFKGGKLCLKNSYGFTVKEIDLKEIKGKKTTYKPLPSKSLLFLLGAKYDK